MQEAIISRIQCFSVGDGPGIRSTVFFQGCNLRCPWCHNPETLPMTPCLLLDQTRCIRCGSCQEICARHRLWKDTHEFLREGCTGCGRCASACRTGALEMSGGRMELAAVMKRIREDAAFYRASGGGVTLSGGEALLQAEACAALAGLCRGERIDVLLDTAGNVAFSAFEKVLPFVNLYYFDLKCGTQSGYEAIGGSLARVKENMKRLVEEKAEVVARIPVIPGFNDSPGEMARMADVLNEVGVTTVNLLPFHRMGSAKYTAMGQTYFYAQTQPIEPERLESFLNIFEQAGIMAKQGG